MTERIIQSIKRTRKRQIEKNNDHYLAVLGSPPIPLKKKKPPTQTINQLMQS